MRGDIDALLNQADQLLQQVSGAKTQIDQLTAKDQDAANKVADAAAAAEAAQQVRAKTQADLADSQSQCNQTLAQLTAIEDRIVEALKATYTV